MDDDDHPDAGKGGDPACWAHLFEDDSSSELGHGSAVRLVEPAELVRGHSPRTQFRLVGTLADMQAILALLKEHYPHANIFYWIVPVLEFGRIR